MIIAVIISAIIMGLWSYFYDQPLRKAQKEARFKAQQEQLFREQETLKANPELAERIAEQAKAGNKITLAEAMAKTREEAIAESPRIRINTNNLHGSIRLQGARFDDITLAKYKIADEKNSPEVEILSPNGQKISGLIEINWISADKSIKAPDSNSEWKIEGNDTLSVGNPVTLTWDNGQGYKFTNTYSVDDGYMFSVTQKIENNSYTSGKFYPYGLINKTQLESEKMEAMMLHTGPLGVMDGKLTEMSYSALIDKEKVNYDNATGWIGITDKYWFKSLIPAHGETYKANFRYFKEDHSEKFQVDFLGREKTVPAGGSVEYTANFFAGAKELDLLEKYRDGYNIPLFDRAIDFGWFYFLSKPLMKLLKFFYEHISNFGLCILLLTFCVKLCLFPLAKKSYISMGKLKLLAPKIKDLQTRFKDDKIQMNREMMELYKKERVNPASGCLPILLQIPVFIALYKVFFVSIEMRHAPFFGWVTDLSAKDPTTIFNFFGLLPYDVPSFLMFGIWPILWALTMVLQQKISPAPTDPTQAQIMKFMPWMFLILFSSMPAGLVIYWTFSNLLSIAQQLYFLKHMPKK